MTATVGSLAASFTSGPTAPFESSVAMWIASSTEALNVTFFSPSLWMARRIFPASASCAATGLSLPSVCAITCVAASALARSISSASRSE